VWLEGLGTLKKKSNDLGSLKLLLFKWGETFKFRNIEFELAVYEELCMP
jgi:hypothetical protein